MWVSQLSLWSNWIPRYLAQFMECNDSILMDIVGDEAFGVWLKIINCDLAGLILCLHSLYQVEVEFISSCRFAIIFLILIIIMFTVRKKNLIKFKKITERIYISTKWRLQ